MDREFREWQPDAGWRFPPSPRDGLPENRLVNYLRDVTGRQKARDHADKMEAEGRRRRTNPVEAGAEESIGVFTADTGYFSEGNLESLNSNARIDDAFVATGRQKHSDPVSKSPGGRSPKNQTPKQKMARRNRTKKGRAENARRKVIVERVFGQIKSSLGFREFSCCERLRRCKANGNGSVPFTICSSYSGAVRFQLADRGKKGQSAPTRQCIDDNALTHQASQPRLSHVPNISRQIFSRLHPDHNTAIRTASWTDTRKKWPFVYSARRLHVNSPKDD